MYVCCQSVFLLIVICTTFINMSKSDCFMAEKTERNVTRAKTNELPLIDEKMLHTGTNNK